MDKIQEEAMRIIKESSENGVDPRVALNDALSEFTQKIATNKAKAVKTQARYETLNKDYLNQDAFAKDKIHGMESLIMDGSSGKFKGANAAGANNIESGRRVIQNKFNAMVFQELGEIPGMLKRLKSGADDLALRKLALGENIKVDGDLMKAFKTIKKVQDMLFEEKRLAGFDTKYLADRFGRQKHSIKGMEALGDEKWIALAKDTISQGDRTDDEFQAMLLNMWEKRVEGSRKGFFSVDDDFKSVTTNMSSNKMEHKRVINFKDAESAHKYNLLVNDGESVLENLAKEIEFDSGTIAAAKIFGPNFRSSFKKLKAGMDLTPKKEAKLDSLFQQSINPSRDPGTSIWAKTFSKARKLTDMAKLGNAVLTTMTDFGYSANVIAAMTGKNALQIQGKVIGGMFENLKGANRMKAGSMLHTFMEDAISNTSAGRLGEGLSSSTWFDRAHAGYMKITGLSQQSNAMRQANAKFSSTLFSELGDIPFEKLTAHAQGAMGKYGISAADWNIIKKGAQDFGDGSKGLTAEGISALGHGEIGDKWSAFLTFTAEMGSPTAGLKQNAWKHLVDPDSFLGQVAISIGQYKSFTLAMADTMQTLALKGDKLSVDSMKRMDLGRTASTIAMSTAWGYAALVAKDFASGKEDIDMRRDPTKGSTYLDAALQGGAGMIFADVLMGDYEKSYKSLGKDVLGPSWGIVEGAAELFAAAGRTVFADDKEKAITKLSKRALDIIEQNTPSIPITKAIINKNVFDAFRKMTDTQKRTRSDNRFRPEALE